MTSTDSIARPRNPRRYTVYVEAENIAVLKVYAPDGTPTAAVCFWSPISGGYVREITVARPGTLGLQVCEGLSHYGNTLYRSAGENLATIIRREARTKRGQARIDAIADAPF